MINKISLGSINAAFQGNTNILDRFKENLKNGSVNQNVNLNGNEALANYNRPIIKSDTNSLTPDENIDKFIIKDTPSPVTLKGDEIETLSGERILDNDGKLEAIIAKDDKTTKEYHIDKDSKTITKIVERDNATGFPIRIDHFGIKYNSNTSGTVQEFIPQTNKLKKETSFDEGKLRLVKIFDDDKNIENTFENDGKLRWINTEDNKTGFITHYTFDENNQIKFVDIEDENYNILKEISYQNGKIKEVAESKLKPLTNTYGITPDNIALKPAEFVEAPKVSALEGEKKFRENGSLESVTVSDGNTKTEYITGYDGKNVREIKVFDNDEKIKNIFFSETGNVNIQEFKNGKLYKTTFYNSSKRPDCIIEYTEKGEVAKIVSYSFDGTFIRKYSDEKNPQFGYISLEFDKDKQLIAVSIRNIEKNITESED